MIRTGVSARTESRCESEIAYPGVRQWLRRTARGRPLSAIVTELKGGLGNQMFQYAAGRALSLRLGRPLTLDLSWFDQHAEETSRRYALDAFPIEASRTSVAPSEATKPSATLLRRIAGRINSRWDRRRGVVVDEPHWHYWDGFERIAGPAHLRGYWQSPRYFEAVAAAIRGDFSFPQLPSDQSRDLAARISQAACAVAVHVRRGDYVGDPHIAAIHGGCCSAAYYGRALEQLAGAYGPLDLFVFSDEPNWVKTNFDTHGHQAVVVDIASHKEASYHDMHLMTLSRHHVIANSSFSWWGAWLGRVPEGSVIAPKTWFNRAGAYGAYVTEDVYPRSWIRL